MNPNDILLLCIPAALIAGAISGFNGGRAWADWRTARARRSDDEMVRGWRGADATGADYQRHVWWKNAVLNGQPDDPGARPAAELSRAHNVDF